MPRPRQICSCPRLLVNVLESILLRLIPGRQGRAELALEVLDRSCLSRVVGGHGRALESLSEDLVAHANALRVEGRREELALRLRKVSKSVTEPVPGFVPSSNPISA